VNKFEVGMDLDATWDVRQANGSLLSLTARTGIRYDLIGDQMDTNATFAAGGAAFDTQGLEQGRLTANIGAGLTYQSSDNWNFSVSYDLERKADFTAHSGFVRTTYSF
jgi:uncharacterized protein with beta-barrel porin domain